MGETSPEFGLERGGDVSFIFNLTIASFVRPRKRIFFFRSRFSETIMNILLFQEGNMKAFFKKKLQDYEVKCMCVIGQDKWVTRNTFTFMQTT